MSANTMSSVRPRRRAWDPCLGHQVITADQELPPGVFHCETHVEYRLTKRMSEFARHDQSVCCFSFPCEAFALSALPPAFQT